ncbi:MAG: hypothetical protein AAGC53_18450 [Actinomycetota bacterium]
MDDVTERSEVELIDIDLDWPGSVDDHAIAPTSTSKRRNRLRFDPRWLILVAVIGYVGWIISSSVGEETPDDDATPDPAATVPVSSEPEETVTLADDQVSLAGDPSLDLAAAIDEVSTLNYVTAYVEMQHVPNSTNVFAQATKFDAVPGGFRFGYIGVDGRAVVIDTSNGEWRSVVDEVPFASDSGFAVLPDGSGVLGLDAAGGGEALRVATDFSVVRRHTGDLLGIRETEAGIEFGPVGDPDAWSTLPAGAEYRIEPSVGVFIAPRSGGIYELTATGTEYVSPFEVISSNGSRWIERRRVPGPDEYWIVDRSGDSWPIDREVIEVRDGLSISPDGAWVFATGGFVDQETPEPVFLGIETGTIVQVDGGADGLTPVWAPDSSFVAEHDPTRSCIWLSFTSGLNGCIVLDRLNVPALEASALVIY